MPTEKAPVVEVDPTIACVNDPQKVCPVLERVQTYTSNRDYRDSVVAHDQEGVDAGELPKSDYANTLVWAADFPLATGLTPNNYKLLSRIVRKGGVIDPESCSNGPVPARDGLWKLIFGPGPDVCQGDFLQTSTETDKV